ncbi:MAG: SMP-30/gluconolactonase/LRE family protein, partial [Propionicimonas sp.]|nr:SMP-30/gluconolactonase/LRE family protein [Propionicimonas sp.]
LRPRLGGGALVARAHDLAVSDRDDLADLRAAVRVVDDPRLRCNDGGCDPEGRFYVGTAAVDRARQAGAVWRWDGDGGLLDTVSLLTVAGGLAWSLDGGTAYLNDSGARVTFAFTHDPARGPIMDKLKALEQKATETGAAIGIISALPISVQTLAEWANRAEENGFL